MDQQAYLEDPGFYRRRYPRRTFKRKVGVLFNGQYMIFDAVEVGEGGMSIISETVLTVGRHLVVSFQIPHGGFVSLRAEIKSIRKHGTAGVHGLSFDKIEFTNKRQIRAFVSERTNDRKVI